MGRGSDPACRAVATTGADGQGEIHRDLADRQVVPRARRRTFSNADKRRILQAADLCTKPGEVGALMRREGVYSSSPSTWRHQREAADLATLAP